MKEFITAMASFALAALLIYGTLITVHAEEPETVLPDYIGCEMVETIPTYEDNEYEELFANMSARDWEYLGKAVQCEAGQSNLECAEATVCVILNRVLDQTDFRGKDTVYDVVMQKGQFSTRWQFPFAKPNVLTEVAIANVQEHGAKVIKDKLAEQGWDFLPTDYVYFSVGKATKWAKDFLFTGTPEKNQHHWIGRSKSMY